uniref:Uncharacterized protein n=1 Tax=Tetranychus urticae TaxID=32264 RepID=T1JYJ5_TETUR
MVMFKDKTFEAGFREHPEHCQTYCFRLIINPGSPKPCVNPFKSGKICYVKAHYYVEDDSYTKGYPSPLRSTVLPPRRKYHQSSLVKKEILPPRPTRKYHQSSPMVEKKDLFPSNPPYEIEASKVHSNKNRYDYFQTKKLIESHLRSKPIANRRYNFTEHMKLKTTTSTTPKPVLTYDRVNVDKEIKKFKMMTAMQKSNGRITIYKVLIINK